MTGGALYAALDYVRRGWPVFPCHWRGEPRKRPLTDHGFIDSSHDAVIIAAWWRRWPKALIGVPTGRITGFVALGVDVRAGANGFDTLADIGVAKLPITPTVHTASGGLHLYFRLPERVEIRNTVGGRGSGIGLGLDWRGEGGYVIAPSPDSGYSWDVHCNLDTLPFAPVPIGLMPRNSERSPAIARPIKPATGLSRYAEAALDRACRAIIGAPDGQQETTLNSETFALGTLAGASAIPADFARRALIWAAQQMPDFDHRRPWRTGTLERKVNRAFEDGVRHPRAARRG